MDLVVRVPIEWLTRAGLESPEKTLAQVLNQGLALSLAESLRPDGPRFKAYVRNAGVVIE